jgi:glycosyltransferase involved in cell wall biosynthesis
MAIEPISTTKGVSRVARHNRIVIASRIFAPEVAAAAFRLDALAHAFVDQSCRVSVVTTTPPSGSTAPDTSDDVTVSRFPVLRDGRGNVRGYLQYLSFDLPLFFRLLALRADAVIAEPPPTTGLIVAMTSWLKRRPFAYYAADIWSDAAASTSAPRLVVALLRRVERVALRRSALVLAVSDDVAARVRELGARRIEVVGNGVDTTTFTVDGPRVENSTPLFVYAGTLSEWQGADIFLDAFEELLVDHSDARLHFFGQGVQLAQLQRRAAALPDGRVEFHDLVPPAEIARWLRSATASLVSIRPGQGYDFARPTKLYAAAACGTPVAFAGDGAAGQLVEEHGLGWPVRHEPAAVAEAMRTAIHQQEDGTTDRLRLSRAAWARDHASLAAAGARAASAVLSLLPPQASDSAA